MCRPRSFARKMAGVFVGLVFLFNNVSYGIEFPENKLSAPQFVFQGEEQTPPSGVFQGDIKEFMKDANFLAVAFYIVARFENNQLSQEAIKDEIRKSLKEWVLNEQYRKLLSKLRIDINGIERENGEIKIPYEVDDNKDASNSRLMRIRRGDPNRKEEKQLWQNSGNYEFLIENRIFSETNERDLKGAKAVETNPIIQELIREKQIIEVYVDKNTDELKSNKVMWVNDYRSMTTPAEIFRAESINVHEIFTKAEQTKIINWMKTHCVMGKPVKFRIAIGTAVLGGEKNVESANISHAAISDGTIYIGSILLKHLFKLGNESLRKEILDDHEFKKMRGLNYGSNEDYKRRLSLVTPIIEYAEELTSAISRKDVYFIVDRLKKHLSEKDSLSILEMFSLMNDITFKQYKWPVEAKYTIKHAVALLEKEDEERLIAIFQSQKSKEEDYRNQVLIDDVLLMFEEEVEISKNWIKTHAVELEDSSFWIVSPEIWHEAGGLARVLQYDSVAILDLIQNSNVRFRTMEPWYQYRIGPHGEAVKLDYTNASQITHPFENIIEVDRFTVTVGGKEIQAVVGRGVNDLGIEDFLIKDVEMNGESYYTHSLYNYRNPWEHDSTRGTWEDFSVFYCKAAIEFLKRYSVKEKALFEKQNKKWGKLVIYTQDSQTALIPLHWKIELAREQDKKRKNPKHTINPILESTVNIFKTHTYENRKQYSLAEGMGDNVMNFMEVPNEFRELLKHYGDGGGYVYDMASGGLRSADGQRAVSLAHLLDIAKYDEWVNLPKEQWLTNLFKKLGTEVDILAVSNADNRALTAKVFRRIMRELYGKDVDVEHPTPAQMKETRKQAKRELCLSDGKTYYSSHEKPADGKILNSDQLVMSFSGRLVNNKVGRDRAFPDSNIEQLVKRGVQVLIYGNKQTNNPPSDALADGLVRLTEKLKYKDYAGKLIFVPRFTLEEERALKAASDVGVHDSTPATEAAGFSESDDAVCGGIVVAPLRTGKFYNNEIGEGLFEAPGMPLDFKNLGRGNTLRPKEMTPEGYMKVFQLIIDNKNKLEHYQATSVRLSRVLGVRSKGASELRRIGYDIARKKAKDNVRTKLEESQKMEREKMSLLNLIIVPDAAKNLKEYAIYEISKLVTEGEVREAINLFFTGEAFQNKKENLDVPVGILNNLMEEFEKDKSTEQNIRDFTTSLIRGIVEFSGMDEASVEVAKTVQMMSGLIWIMPEGMRFTLDERQMVQNKKRGRSFIDASKLPEGIIEVKDENKAGFYFRGTEDIAKIRKENIMEFAIYDRKRFENAALKMVQYVMLHGGRKIPERLVELINKGSLSNPHKTCFLNGMLSGSFQPTSTGPGHLQIKMIDGKRVGLLDGKKVNKGRYIQMNVKYSAEARIVKVKAQMVEEGEICFSIPGWRDYMIDLGGYGLEGFDDFSMPVSQDEARMFDPDYDESELAGIEKALDENHGEDYAPYGALIFEKGPIFVKMKEEFPDVVWIDMSKTDFSDISFQERYEQILTSGDMRADFIEKLGNASAKAKKENPPIEAASRHKAETLSKEEKCRIAENPELLSAVSLGMTRGINFFVSDSADCLRGGSVGEQKTDKLIRVPVEILKNVESEELKEFLKTVQSTKHINLELFSTDSPEIDISSTRYEDFGIIKESLPQDFKMSRLNTVTIVPVDKGEEFPSSAHNVKWNRLGFSREATKNPLFNTIISPVGYNYDHTGLVRSVFFGLILSEIAANEDYTENSNFVTAALARYKKLYLLQGESADNFDLTAEDFINMARGDVNALVTSLNKLIKILPIMPVNINEQREIFEHAREAWIRA